MAGEAGGGEEGEDDGPRPRHLSQVRLSGATLLVARLGLDLERSTYTREFCRGLIMTNMFIDHSVGTALSRG